MKLKTLFIFQALVSLINGGMLVIATAFYISFFGFTDPTQETILMSRLLGAALLGYCVTAWLARDSGESIGQKAIVSGLFFGNAVGLIGSIIGQLAGIPNMMGWSIVGLYLILALGFGFFLFFSPTE